MVLFFNWTFDEVQTFNSIYQLNILVPIQAMDQSLGSIDGRVRELVGLVPVPVQVLTQEVAARVAHEDAVRVHDRQNFEDDVRPKRLGHVVH